MESLKFCIFVAFLQVLVIVNGDDSDNIPPLPDKFFPPELWKNIWKEVKELNLPNNDDLKLEPGQHIVGGIEVPIEDYPWQINLMYDGEFSCGGSLISNQWVLTAAHCAVRTLNKYTVRLGSINVTGGGIVVGVSEKYVHKLYRDNSNNYDIAVFKLNSKVRFNDNISPIALPEESLRIRFGTNVTASGWGSLTSAGVYPDLLRAVSMPAITKTKCEAYYGTRLIRDTMICAGLPNQGLDTCQGDSGGPLVAVIKGEPTLVGITSWGFGCGGPKYPGVYVRITAFYHWIKEHTGIDENYDPYGTQESAPQDSSYENSYSH